MNKNQYSVEVLVNGRPVREFQHGINGEQRTFIEARYGTTYSIKVSNNSCQRILAISSVDGLNVVSGNIGDGFKGRGYIVKPYSSVVIKGFRESDDSVGAFEFTQKGKSYAESQGLGRNVGVIACNIIDEKQPIYTTTLQSTYGTCGTSGATSAAWINSGTNTDICVKSSGDDLSFVNYTCNVPNNINNSQQLLSSKSNFDAGTTWGQRINDTIQRASFDKNQIVASFEIFYATKQALQNMGIKFYEEKEIDLPKGFEGYCKPPRGWR